MYWNNRVDFSQSAGYSEGSLWGSGPQHFRRLTKHGFYFCSSGCLQCFSNTGQPRESVRLAEWGGRYSRLFNNFRVRSKQLSNSSQDWKVSSRSAFHNSNHNSVLLCLLYWYSSQITSILLKFYDCNFSCWIKLLCDKCSGFFFSERMGQSCVNWSMLLCLKTVVQ